MSNLFQTRRFVALVAAYVIALQALLLPLSVAAGGPFKSGLCAAALSVDGPRLPAGHDGGCPCAAGCGMQCCAQTLADPPQIMVAFVLTRATAMLQAPAIERVIRSADRSPQVPRAPPAA
jgi:hypothetical protein